MTNVQGVEEEEGNLPLASVTHRINSPSEQQLVTIAGDFQDQFLHLCPNRKPLLLCPTNDWGIKKFVSTSIRPTTTPHIALHTWQGCASFVADFLRLEPLEPPEELPSSLSSLTWVLQTQSGSCFEYATLLCSLLLGENYDAYCVSGYAIKEMCLLDQSLEQCPLLDTQNSEEPLTDLKSCFMTHQELKQKAEAALLQKEKLQECEQRPADPLHGQRVHCWVLVLSGCRSIQENFFIDPLSGTGYPTNSDKFLGIESVWNNLNYYVNMQDCRNGCSEMEFDLEDVRMWEPVLIGAFSRKQLNLRVLNEESGITSKMQEEELSNNEEKPKMLMMPMSWVSSVRISKKDLENRFPGQRKTILFCKAKLESFADNKNFNGLIRRLTTYKDLNRSEEAVVKDWYKYRSDHLMEKENNKLEQVTTERFKPGSPYFLLMYRYQVVDMGLLQEVVFETPDTHLENVVRRLLSPTQMIEYFEGRADRLYYRHTYFNKEVVERFHRNESIPANQDVAERTFLLAQGRINLTYHLVGQLFIPSTRSFIKPCKTKGQEVTLDMHSAFQVDPSEKPLGFFALKNMLRSLMEDEEEVLRKVTNSKKEMEKIWKWRVDMLKGVRICIPKISEENLKQLMAKANLNIK